MIVDREDILVYSGGVEKSNFRLEDLTAYRISSGLSDYVWDIVSKCCPRIRSVAIRPFVSKWDSFNKFTLGQQWVNATDSISGNIAEGFGRYHKKDKIKFYYNSRASVFEAAHWAKKARRRNLISEEQLEHLLNELRRLPKEINTIIKITSKSLEK